MTKNLLDKFKEFEKPKTIIEKSRAEKQVVREVKSYPSNYDRILKKVIEYGSKSSDEDFQTIAGILSNKIPDNLTEKEKKQYVSNRRFQAKRIKNTIRLLMDANIII